MRAILTIPELRKFSRRKSIPTCSIEEICDIEDDEFDKCSILGSELKEAMIKDLKDYSKTAAYDPDRSYIIGDCIIYNSYILQAVVNDPKEPTCALDWTIPDKFNKQCYNELWCDYGLGRYISLKVLISSAVQSSVQWNANGFVKPRGSDFVGASKDDLVLLMNDYKSKANRAYARMKRYINNNDCFDIQTKSCGCPLDDKCSCGKMNTRKWRID